MNIFPAIDMFDHRVVRLLHGDYGQMTVYGDNAVTTAKQFEDAGALWLHVVDLMAARDGDTPDFEVVESICRNTNLYVEVGGGIRRLDTIDRYLNIGVARVIIGTKAVTDPQFLKDALTLYGDKIVVSVDGKDGKVAVKGWREVLDVNMVDFLGQLCYQGAKTAIVTDIGRDGAMEGPNLDLYRKLAVLQKDGLNISASGGISSYKDLQDLKDLGLYGAVLGKAMYQDAVDLHKAIELAGPQTV